MNDPGVWPGPARDGGRPEAQNGGVHVSGGTFNGPVAYGYQGRATQIARDVGANQDVARLERALRDLEAGVRAIGGAEADDALEDLDRVQDELRRRRPDRGRMIELVSRVGAVIAPVSGLVELADHIKDLIGLVAH
jgi:ABC-type transporter Mla subunit MlaD